MNILPINRFIFTNTWQLMRRKIHIGQSCFQEELGQFFHEKCDKYGGVHFEANCTKKELIKTLTKERFIELLNKNIDSLNQNQIKTMWFKFTNENVHLIEPLVTMNFKFHHTKGNIIVMVKTLSGPNNVPKYAFTNIGVGGLVINDNNEILLVKERVKMTNYWKFPGGYVEQDEELYDAVVREVFEETGIRAQFQCILSIRHLHRMAFDCSDLYFVCLLHSKRDQLIKCPNEIDLCDWFHIDSVKTLLSTFNNLMVEKYLQWKINKTGINYEWIRTNFQPPLNEFVVYSLKNS